MTRTHGWMSKVGALLTVAACLLTGQAWSATTMVSYFHNDISGTPMLSTDAHGAVLWKENYRPYGDKLNKPPAALGNKIGFHGKPYDFNTGLSYMDARYYDPVIGRFIGMDPKGIEPGELHSTNRYAYANNNPYRYVDPDGRSPLDVVFLVYDLGKLGVAMYTGVGVGAAAFDVGASMVGVFSPVPFAGQALKAGRGVERGVAAMRSADRVADTARGVVGQAADAGQIAKATVNGENAATKAGRAAHKNWDPGKGFEKEVRLPSGKRADAVNFEERHVKELKPDNPRAMTKGEKQVEAYRQELQKEYGGNWRSSVEGYRR